MLERQRSFRSCHDRLVPPERRTSLESVTLKRLVHWAREFRQNQSQLRQIRRSLAASKHVSGSRSHPLSKQVVITLTSYPPRFLYLHLVLRSLLYQSVSVKVILYIQGDDLTCLPNKVLSLQASGLEIRSAPVWRSFTKLVPALSEFPEKYIITADDDVIYAADFVETLLIGVLPDEDLIICTRAHRIFRHSSGEVAPYSTWPHDVQDNAARRPSVDLVATGVGGVLYPPGSLHPLALNMEVAMAICPRADDLWFYWMARKRGSLYRKVGPKLDLLHTPDSQVAGLWQENLHGGNDEQIDRLIAEFGIPEGIEAPKLPNESTSFTGNA